MSEAADFHLTDETSIAAYGTYTGSVSTRIAGRHDAESRARAILDQQSTPAWVLGGVAIFLELVGQYFDVSEAADAATTAQILGLEMHDLIAVVDMPEGSPFDATGLWVEGWTETITAGSWRIDFATSEFCRTAAAPAWDDQDPAVTWNTAEDLTWDQIRCFPIAPTTEGAG